MQVNTKFGFVVLQFSKWIKTWLLKTNAEIHARKKVFISRGKPRGISRGIVSTYRVLIILQILCVL